MPTALVVDDDQPMVSLIAEILRMDGYEVVATVSPSSAFERIEAGERFDVALLDVVMPEMSGDELGATLRRHQPDVPILYVTGCADRLFSERTILWHREFFLEKPFTPQGLLEAVSLAASGRLARLPAPS